MDLPGYGYAKVTEKVKEQWGHMIEKLSSDLQTAEAGVPFD